MFRHPNLKHSDEPTDDFLFEQKIDQSIRYFQVPAMKEKEDVLNLLMQKISDSESINSTTNNVRQLYYALVSVAATGLVLIVLYFTLGVETLTGQQSTSNVFYLPDQSRVVLAEGAQLKYSKLLYKRSVNLKGKAYFEVVHGTGFYVNTREGGVLVIGTRFSVSDLNRRFIVHCYEGMVGVDYGNKKVKIVKGMEFSGASGQLDVVEDKNTGYPEFAKFNFTCQNKQLSEIWPLIEDYFGVEIVDDLPESNSFTGSIHTGNVNEVIDIICTSMGLTSRIGDNHQIYIEPKAKI